MCQPVKKAQRSKESVIEALGSEYEIVYALSDFQDINKSAVITISDPEAVMILVAIIRQHGISVEDILDLPEIKKSKLKPANIQGFMEFHGLLKKIPDSGH